MRGDVGPILQQVPAADDVKVNRDKGVRSCEWVEVTDLRRRASCGEAHTARVVRQSRNAGPRDVTKRKVFRQCPGEESFRSGTDARVSTALLHMIYTWGKFKFANSRWYLIAARSYARAASISESKEPR